MTRCTEQQVKTACLEIGGLVKGSYEMPTTDQRVRWLTASQSVNCVSPRASYIEITYFTWMSSRREHQRVENEGLYLHNYPDHYIPGPSLELANSSSLQA